ncbi:hypothetical protein SMJ63A_70141 [Stenotrophomonas geniculata]
MIADEGFVMFRRRLRPPSFYAEKRANRGWHLPDEVSAPTEVGFYRAMRSAGRGPEGAVTIRPG